jgi:ABC-type multidrug transport system ATPase subunit
MIPLLSVNQLSKSYGGRPAVDKVSFQVLPGQMGGMKRRLNIATALLHDPELLILDEPTVGVDPQSRNAIFDTLEALQCLGRALIYTSHYMEEVERLAQHIVTVDHGKVIANKKPGFALPAARRCQPATPAGQSEDDTGTAAIAAQRAGPAEIGRSRLTGERDGKARPRHEPALHHA